MIHQRWNFGVWVGFHKAAAELIAIADIDDVGVIFRAFMTEGQQLFQHGSDLHTVGRGQRVELKWMITYWQNLIVGWAGNGPVCLGPLSATFGVPFPNFGWGIC